MPTRLTPDAFPDGFLWGAATSAHQTEGNNANSDWWALEHREGSPTVEPSRDACDSYHRFGEDIELLASAGLQSYRFGIEWARIEPAPGEFSDAALAHYQRMIDECHRQDVEPVVTLHHFTNPIWVRELGGWAAPDAADRFGRYVERVLSTLDGVSRYCTINEPNIIAAWAAAISGSAMGGEAHPSPELTQTLVAAHQRAVEIVQSHGAEAGMTLAMTAFTTDGTPEAAAAVAEHRQLDEDAFIEGARTGDFLGVQAYTRRFATAQRVLEMGHDFDGPSERTTQTGWNYYPQCIGDCLVRAHQVAPELPLIVTENGIATSDDEERVAYTSDALKSVLAAIHDGVPVSGYYHWSLLDNFEWVAGYRPTFGLIAVDRETFVRTPKPSLEWLGRVAKGNALVP
jgi:beta-glucosidase